MGHSDQEFIYSHVQSRYVHIESAMKPNDTFRFGSFDCSHGGSWLLLLANQALFNALFFPRGVTCHVKNTPFMEQLVSCSRLTTGILKNVKFFQLSNSCQQFSKWVNYYSFGNSY